MVLNAGSMSETLLRVEDLRVWFPVRIGFLKKAYIKAVDGVSLTLDKGHTIAIVGESGCGKTTLGRAIARLVKPTSGRILFNGHDVTHIKGRALKEFRREVQVIFQDPFSSLCPTMPVFKILEEPLLIHKIGSSRDERMRIIEEALKLVRLNPPEEFLWKYPHQLSGGQRQRVAIARAIILRPKLIIADEPVSMIDASNRVEILQLLKGFQEKLGTSYIYITHDIATTRVFSEHIAVMYVGKIVELGPTHRVLENPLHPYTKFLIEAVPDVDSVSLRRERRLPEGEPPNPLNPPSGCRFHPRCPFATDVCKKEEPPLMEIESGHYAACWILKRL